MMTLLQIYNKSAGEIISKNRSTFSTVTDKNTVAHSGDSQCTISC